MFQTLEKQTALSQIPGLTYRPEVLANLPKPSTWDDRKMSDATRLSIVFRPLGTATLDPSLPDSAQDLVLQMNARLHTFYQHCEANNIIGPSGFDTLPTEFKQLV